MLVWTAFAEQARISLNLAYIHGGGSGEKPRSLFMWSSERCKMRV